MKQYFTGFFTAICLVTSFFLFIGAYSEYKELDRPIVIKGKNGTTMLDGDAIYIGGHNSPSEKVYLGLSNGDGGILHLKNRSNNQVVYLGTFEEEDAKCTLPRLQDDFPSLRERIALRLTIEENNLL